MNPYYEKRPNNDFTHIIHAYDNGEIYYIYSAPCLSINRPAFDYWTRIREGKGVINLGGAVWAATTDKES
jgi:hypothetical protein